MSTRDGLNLDFPTWAYQPRPGWSLWRMVWKLTLCLVIGAVVLYGILWLIALAIS